MDSPQSPDGLAAVIAATCVLSSGLDQASIEAAYPLAALGNALEDLYK